MATDLTPPNSGTDKRSRTNRPTMLLLLKLHEALKEQLERNPEHPEYWRYRDPDMSDGRLAEQFGASARTVGNLRYATFGKMYELGSRETQRQRREARAIVGEATTQYEQLATLVLKIQAQLDRHAIDTTSRLVRLTETLQHQIDQLQARLERAEREIGPS